MIARIWSGQNKLYLLLLPFSLLYGCIATVRRWLYKTGVLPSWKAPVPVIVVGNLSVGGNGKTPVVIYLVEELQKRGHRVGVISRGYGGKSENYPLILNETTTTAQAGDEPVLIFQRTQVPVAVAPKRSEAAKALLEKYQLDVIVTDDGLQHYALQRDIEIVVIDGTRWFGNGWWLPAGPMRESQRRLKSVDFTIINGNSESDHGLINPVTMQLKPQQVINLQTGEKRGLSELSHIQAMAGIGHPARFFDMLMQLGAIVESQHAFADHQDYLQDQLQCLATPAQSLLMTEKDAVKCRSYAQQNWWYLPISATLPETFITDVTNKLEILKHKA
ncbi:tetraacyldisaccharide 4'-kinase [Zophobihabitans entericus]|uniref:Tetraacyldisaccharide 4'-kinase n=1 Tax=Zophobihabitans entericus TaxID=1635327 RepID=A0A6G9IC83_9GAMM|nr:tetraacyldisaccharide 4'-kinase [Zophobihabitans entericus]QIQ21823.1 tetraacyldisaccharide 4'-kinase [Zophobihabitans entericus]